MSVGGRDLSVMFIGGAVMDLLVIPWPHVVARFVRARGDRWKGADADKPHSSHPSVRPTLTTGRS